MNVTVSGANLGTVAEPPIVRFGSAEALIVDPSLLPDSVVVALPPAPQGLPGTYDVTVIHTSADQQQAVLHDAFTYYMDGRPVITEIEPNHTEFDPNNPPTTTDKTYVTIRGYNFDDIVRVHFTDPSGDEYEQTYYSVSPTEIVVSLPDFQTELVLDAATDYTSGVATLQVTVQNDPLTLHTVAEEQSLTSDPPTEFYVYNDARGDVTPAGPIFAFNNVYFNRENYINSQPGTGSISVDPMFDTGQGTVPVPGPKLVAIQPGGWWYGKLLATALSAGEFRDNPVRNKAGEFTADPYTTADFEYEPRPDPPQNQNIQGTGSTGDELPDIGADEINGFNDADCGWLFARPTPNPVGALEAGDLQVEIQVTPGCIDPAAFIVPQGADPELDAHRIHLNLIVRLGRGGYLYRNEEPIQTLLEDNDLDGEPSQGDYLMDGHAAIYLVDARDDTNIIGYDETLGVGDLTEGGLIQSQAVYGRHFIIDTIPPRIRVESATYGTNGFDNVIIGASPVGIMTDSNDTIDANATPDAALHPFPLPPALLPDGTQWDPANIDVPVDYLGGITLPPLAGVDGTKVFFNPGSISNYDAASPPPTNLTFTATIEYIDPPVTDPDGNEIGGNPEDQDIFIPAMDTRQRAGFLPVEPPTDAFDIGAGRWLYADGTSANFMAGAPVIGTYTTSGAGPGSNQGVYDPAFLEATGDGVPPPVAVQDISNEVLTATWTVQAPGIDWNLADADTFHVAARLIAEDLAGNSTPDEEDFNADPLHIWWLLEAQSRLVPDREGQATNRPTFTMQLNRSYDPQAAGGPVPIFMYRIYASTDYQGPYTPVTGWSAWTASTSIDTFSTLGVVGQWLLVVCQGADEAGNVEPWWGGLTGPTPVPPADGPIDLTDPLYDEWARQLPNWQRFFYSGIEAPDTKVDPTFWYDANDNSAIDAGETSFGRSRLIPLPGDYRVVPVRAQFLVSTARPPGSSGDYLVQWEFLQDGKLVDSQVLPQTFTSDTQAFAIYASTPPVITNLDGTIFLGDVPLPGENRPPQRPITYVFRARAFIDSDGDGVPSLGDIADQTPANVYFTVVPTGVPNYVKSPTDEDSQPIKEQEIR